MQQKLFKVRDLRKKTQYKIDDEYLNGYARIFGVATTAVYNSLARHAEFSTQQCFPSEKKIAEEHNITSRTVRRAIQKLKSANIIKIERKKSSIGKWLNNTYLLLDKSEWIKLPEDIRDQARGHQRPMDSQRTLETKPEDIRDQARGHQRPIKDNTLEGYTLRRRTHIAGKPAEINQIFDIFYKEINPTISWENKTQRRAAQFLIDKLGLAKAVRAAAAAIACQGQLYAPVITTPYQLKEKLSQLVLYYQREKNKKIKIFKI